jgi:hypothetical protein
MTVMRFIMLPSSKRNGTDRTVMKSVEVLTLGHEIGTKRNRTGTQQC